MPREYTVVNNETGQEVTFDWNLDTDPTDKDLEEIFSEAAKTVEPESTFVQKAVARGKQVVERGAEAFGAAYAAGQTHNICGAECPRGEYYRQSTWWLVWLPGLQGRGQHAGEIRCD